MATYIVLIDFTDKGVREFRDSADRAGRFKRAAEQAGASVRQVFWTLGHHDGVLILDAPDEQTATALLLSLGSQGFVRTHALRAFDESQIEQILGQAQ